MAKTIVYSTQACPWCNVAKDFLKETAELEKANKQAWASLPPNYQWLKKWEYV